MSVISCVRAGGQARLLQFGLALVCGLVLQGCGGGAATTENVASGSSSGTPVTPATSNQGPRVSGTPATAVSAGQAYSFAPTASDPDGNALTFSIQNKPSWATFSASTGKLTGTPASAGTFANIVISVSDGTVSAALPSFSITVSAAPSSGTGAATLNWTPPTARSDGSTLQNLAGYHIRYGTSADALGNLVNVTNPGLATYVIENLSVGTYYFAITAYDSNGQESDLSNTVSKTIG